MVSIVKLKSHHYSYFGDMKQEIGDVSRTSTLVLFTTYLSKNRSF